MCDYVIRCTIPQTPWVSNEYPLCDRCHKEIEHYDPTVHDVLGYNPIGDLTDEKISYKDSALHQRLTLCDDCLKKWFGVTVLFMYNDENFNKALKNI